MTEDEDDSVGIALMLAEEVRTRRDGDWTYLDDGGVQRAVPSWWISACVPQVEPGEEGRLK